TRSNVGQSVGAETLIRCAAKLVELRENRYRRLPRRIKERHEHTEGRQRQSRQEQTHFVHRHLRSPETGVGKWAAHFCARRSSAARDAGAVMFSAHSDGSTRPAAGIRGPESVRGRTEIGGLIQGPPEHQQATETLASR